MRILIAGVDGYLGWPLALTLAAEGHEVGGIDAYYRRDWVAEMGSQSATPIRRMTERLQAFHDAFGESLDFRRGDLRDYNAVLNLVRAFEPEAIVHLGEQPSAPYSMVDVQHAVYTQTNNIVGTLNLLFAMREACPRAHLVKLGTMGEYGTPDLDIPEGWFELEFRGRKERALFPRRANSWYHQSKVHDSHNVEMACRLWGLRSTDVMQGVVYGTRIPEIVGQPALATRFDFDQAFGTAINRFCAQAVIGLPLTPYGRGHQKRGFLPLVDSMQCMTIAVENPPQAGEYRVFNQFEDVYDVSELAARVQRVAVDFGLDVKIHPMENPRAEAEQHYYKPDARHLRDLGYRPASEMDAELRGMFSDLLPHRARIEERKEAQFPDIRWDGSRRRSDYLSR